MFNKLRNHPFAVEAFFERSTVLTFAVSKEQLQEKIPNCFSLDTFEDHWAFLTVAMVQTKKLRPKGFPKFMGNDFFLIGYRIFVRYKTKDGRNLRGLYILKSETDHKMMEFLGGLFTRYTYETIDITQKNKDNLEWISSQKSNFQVCLNRKEKKVTLPVNSPFKDWKEARKFAGPMPYTFTYLKDQDQVLLVKGIRQNWDPRPLQVESYKFAKLESYPNIILANAFEVENIPYHWEKGVLDK